ncbi:MAG: glycine cleavage system protein GcvH [Microcoleaceae cyanobacterium]
MGLEYPSDLKYTESHEYVRLDGEIATIGISAFAVDQLGDIVFVELPQINDAVEKDGSMGSVESVKAVEDLIAPISGTVIERNDSLEDSPEKLNEDPYGEAWLLKVRVDDLTEIDEAYSAEEYLAMVEGE